MVQKQLPNDKWENWVNKVILHVPEYLSPTGEYTSGGRQRNVIDIARLIKENWVRDFIIVQKALSNWEKTDLKGNPVIGLKSPLRAYGDPVFGLKTARLIHKGSAIIYIGGEDAWPFFVKGAKGFHTGIWWDGPYPAYKKLLTSIRTEALFRNCRSVLCVDTNVINWLRGRSSKNHELANRAIYVPNCVDLKKLPYKERKSFNTPIRILFARRFDPCRGPELALDTIALLAKRGVPVRLIMSTTNSQAGSNEIYKWARARGIENIVDIYENDLESIFSLYEQADIGFVPTLWSEGTSFSCIEAICAGLPVVTTTVGGLPNIVVPWFNGFVCPPKPDHLAKAIEIFTNPEIWLKLHRNCLSMRESFSKDTWDKIVLEWIKS